jgi:phenylacetate-CoA ligase
MPFYRELWAEWGFDATTFRGLADLARLPVVSADDARMALRQVDSRDSYATSGSSGRPLSVPRSASEQRVWRAAGLRIWLEHGYRWSDVTLRFDSQAAPRHPLQRLGLSRTLWISNELPLERRVDELLGARARVVVGTPTVLRQVCGVLESRGVRPARPRVVFVQGEVCDLWTRALVARVFGVEPVDLYGLTEVGYVAWQCERRGALHVNAEAYLVEVLRDERPAVAGEFGRVVITDLRGRTMPLLRYDTGDLALVANARCACSRPSPVLGRMEGRADGTLLRRDGGIVTTRAVLDALGPDGFRVRQDLDGQVELQVTPETNAARLSAELEALLGQPVARTTMIAAEPESAEKTRWVVSGLRPDL